MVKTNLPIWVLINLPVEWVGGLCDLVYAEGSALGLSAMAAEAARVHLPAPR